MRSNLPTSAPKENMTDNLQFDLIFLLIGCFILYVLGQIIDFIFKPLKAISQKEVDEEIRQLINTKRFARQTKVINDPNDPIYQFKLRFITNQKEYKKDKENNELYFAWFQEWKNGNIIDSDLRWAPDVLEEDGGLRYNFLQYMKIQLVLHKNASLLRRVLFMRTISKYYPELSPTMKGLEEDLANYDEERDEITVENELKDEIQKFGLPEDFAEYLIEKNLSARELHKEAKLLKRYIELGHTFEACICVLENKLDKENFTIVEFLLEKGLPTKVALAYINGGITDEETLAVAKLLDHVLENYGMDAFTIVAGKNVTAYDDILDQELLKYKNQKFAHKINKKV